MVEQEIDAKTFQASPLDEKNFEYELYTGMKMAMLISPRKG